MFRLFGSKFWLKFRIEGSSRFPILRVLRLAVLKGRKKEGHILALFLPLAPLLAPYSRDSAINGWALLYVVVHSGWLSMRVKEVPSEVPCLAFLWRRRRVDSIISIDWLTFWQSIKDHISGPAKHSSRHGMTHYPILGLTCGRHFFTFRRDNYVWNHTECSVRIKSGLVGSGICLDGTSLQKSNKSLKLNPRK